MTHTCRHQAWPVSGSQAFVVVASLLGISCSTANGPTAASPTLRSVGVACFTTTLNAFGQTTRCTATATLSNGRTEEQTADSTWTSSSMTVATVDPTGLVTAVGQGTTTITAVYRDARASQVVTVDVPLTLERFRYEVTRTRVGSGFRFTGTIDLTLNRPIVPAPSRVRAELQNSSVGGSTDYGGTGGTAISIIIDQFTPGCPNTTNTPPDYMRLIDVDRQATLTSRSALWNGDGLACSPFDAPAFSTGRSVPQPSEQVVSGSRLTPTRRLPDLR